ncbi:MAG: AAA family ATPase [Flavobacterium sp.]
MYKIGFQNFRRFTDFQPIEYKGITFLVGRNNAGKSTLVKALLLINDFLKSDDITTFSFGSNSLEDTNIVTYGRAKNRNATEDCIKFYYQIDNYTIEIVISGDDDKTLATVHKVLITDISENLEFLLEPRDKSIKISKLSSKNTDVEDPNNNTIRFLNSEIKRLREQIENKDLKKTSKEFIFLVEELNSIEKKRDLITPNKKSKKEENIYSISTFFPTPYSLNEIIDFTISEALFLYNRQFNEIQQGKESTTEFENYRGFYEESIKIEKSFQTFHDKINSLSIVYLGANPAKQSALFPIRDRNNALAQAIHDFYQLRISKGEKAYEFVEKWIVAFEIGYFFNILLHAGEAYEVRIDPENIDMHLADKGMGSIQAMLLILRLASIIHKRKFTSNIATIIIEEPELNLHPALQSKLADLFLEVSLPPYNLNFIIETHSEYILRRSQVLVAEKEFAVGVNENPFCVYYFPKDSENELQPYRLEYQADGVFSRNFGDGFFDEASSSTLELLKLKRQKKA